MYLARVKAGHDRNQYYVVQSQDEKFVYLVMEPQEPVTGRERKATNMYSL